MRNVHAVCLVGEVRGAGAQLTMIFSFVRTDQYSRITCAFIVFAMEMRTFLVPLQWCMRRREKCPVGRQLIGQAAQCAWKSMSGGLPASEESRANHPITSCMTLVLRHALCNEASGSRARALSSELLE